MLKDFYCQPFLKDFKNNNLLKSPTTYCHLTIQELLVSNEVSHIKKLIK